jgi:prepilin-type N-terminal cleavage/methylation domain-containing protein
MKSCQTGFTLIEVMVVMVILSFGLVAVVGATGQAARSTRAIAELESLRQAAEQVMATELSAERMSRERSEGSLGQIKWVLEVSDDPEFANLKHLKVTTFATDKTSEKQGRRFTIESRQAQLGVESEEV